MTTICKLIVNHSNGERIFENGPIFLILFVINIQIYPVYDINMIILTISTSLFDSAPTLEQYCKGLQLFKRVGFPIAANYPPTVCLLHDY